MRLLAALGSGDASVLEAVKTELDAAEVREPSFKGFKPPAGRIPITTTVYLLLPLCA